jgi:hypothetical protein
VIVCWSLKGGSGTTVVSAALALTLAQRSNSAVRIVDIAGDIPSALGIAEPSGEGVTNWLQQPQRAPIQSLQIPVTARVSLLPRGTGPLMHHDFTAEHCNTLATELEGSGFQAPKQTPDAMEQPQELLDAFSKEPEFQHAFEALTPGRQRGYLLHFSGAKQSKTRADRIEKHRARILEGLGLHDTP